MPHPSHHSWFDNPNNVWRWVPITEVLIMQFFQPPEYPTDTLKDCMPMTDEGEYLVFTWDNNFSVSLHCIFKMRSNWMTFDWIYNLMFNVIPLQMNVCTIKRITDGSLIECLKRCVSRPSQLSCNPHFTNIALIMFLFRVVWRRYHSNFRWRLFSTSTYLPIAKL
jgi:hypothetical protein